MTRVIVCGGRFFDNYAYLANELDKLHQERTFAAFMQGGNATWVVDEKRWIGADYLAKCWAHTKSDLSGKRYECKAQWERFGKAAGPIRNTRMLQWKPTLVAAFDGGIGTEDMVRKALDAGIEVIRIGW